MLRYQSGKAENCQMGAKGTNYWVIGENMTASMDKTVAKTRFEISDLQKRISVLDATRSDLERQIQKLIDSVPEDDIDASAERDGFVAYGSYAKSVIARKDNLRVTLDDINAQTADLANDLREAMSALDSFERVRARRLAAQAEKALKRA